MDFMKVFDQAVREIKREVNLKVLKVPEIEQKVLDATNDESWGPHGNILAEIAQATKKFSECQIVMNVIWTRLIETDKNWRFVYKTLAVIEYLVANGSERALDDILEHTFQISSLTKFEYVEPNGKDVGLNVRKKAETIVGLLNDTDKIQQVRDKAATNRDKYFGLSSTGITYKSGAASFGSSNFKNNDRYGGFNNTLNSGTSNASYKDNDRYGEYRYEKNMKSKKDSSLYGSKKQDSPATRAAGTSTKNSQLDKHASVSSNNESSNKYDGDFDDFDPRGTLSSKSSAGSNQVDLFGPNFIDMFDAPVPVPTDNKPTSLNKVQSEVDLFADADFVSATPEPEAGKSPVPQTNVDLFASQPTPSVSSPIDFFATPDPATPPGNDASKPDTASNVVDPFAAVPMNNFNVSDSLGTLASQTDPLSIKSDKISPNDGNGGKNNESLVATESPPKKEAFQVKSGIWADSFNRGLFDLNITAPAKKVNLADVGIVGGLTDGSEEKDKGHLPSFYMGSAMGVGSGAGKSAFTSTLTSTSMSDDDFFSSLSNQQYQYGGSQK
ncbi:hypothetical protein CASFOL_011139 [Castilleja foliolosa]|uniref:ENTH domain-containing protein n=1 Tax=Castilleja foliolosa TaxID=1961234 RepID=A0ABD3DVM9_9LAMI